MIEHAKTYQNSDFTKTISPCHYSCIALLSLATAFDTKGKAARALAETIYVLNPSDDNVPDRGALIAHAAFQGESDCLNVLKYKNILPSKDLLFDSFSETIKNEANYSIEEKYEYALTLFEGTEAIKSQPLKGLALAALLARRYPQEWQGHKLLMLFANGYTKSNGPYWKQNILKADFNFAKRHAEKFHAIKKDAHSFAWLGVLERKVGNLTSSKNYKDT